MRHFYLLLLWLPVHGQPSLSLPKAAGYSARLPVQAFLQNPATLALSEGKGLWIAGGRSYMLIPAFSLAAQWPLGGSGFGFHAGYSGDAILREMQGGLAYGRRLADQLGAGILFNYQSAKVPALAAEKLLTIDGGLLMQLTPALLTGIRVSKPVLGPPDNRPGTSFHAGLGYTLSDRFVVAAIASKIPERAASLQLAADYQFADRLSASLGYLSGNASWFFGTAMGFTGFQLEASAQVHPYLGISPVLSILFQEKKKTHEVDR